MTWYALPKTELHLHLDCSISYAVASIIEPSITIEEYNTNFIAPVKCKNLMDFLSLMPHSLAMMQTKEHLHLVTLDLFRQLQADNVIYAEIRFAPILHTKKGLTPLEVVSTVNRAVAQGVHESGVEARLILCTLREYTEVQSLETVKLAEKFLNNYVGGFDIASNESLPIDPHVSAFRYARDKGIPRTAHAGEARGPESMWETLQHFDPSRIGHGVRSIEDTGLVEHLRDSKVHLEVNPSCNVQIDMYDTLADHPIDKLYRAGVSVGINTDCRGLGNRTLTDEYEKLHQTFGWEAKDFLKCNINALNAAFIPSDLRDKLAAKLIEGYPTTL